MKNNNHILTDELKEEFIEYVLSRPEIINEFYNAKVAKIELDKQALLHSLNGISHKPIIAEKHPSSMPSRTKEVVINVEDSYDPEWPLPKKAVYGYLKIGKGSTTRNLTEFVGVNFDSKLIENHGQLRKSVARFSATIGQRIGSVFGKVENAKGDIVYGLIEWFNPDGSLKNEYK